MFWKYFALLLGGLAAMAISLGLAYRYELEWLRVVALTVPVAFVGLGAMFLKRRRQRADRTSSPDSVEYAEDVRARAGAYVFALVATAIALAVGVASPSVPSWIILLGLLAVLVIGYGISRLWVNRSARQ